MFSPQIRVLIIDDSAIARNTLSRILKQIQKFRLLEQLLMH